MGSRAGKGLAGQWELGWDKGISTPCAFPFEFVAWATQKFKAKRQMCLHILVIYSSGLIGNSMISSTISQLFSQYLLPTCDALAGKRGGAASPPPHSCHAVTNLAGSGPEGAQPEPQCFAGISPNCSHVGATAPAATRSPKYFQAGEAPAAAWRHSHRGMGASVSLLPVQAHRRCPRGNITAFSYPIKNVFEGT